MKLASNGQQLSATHSLPQILDVFEGLGVKAIEIWPSNLAGGGDAEQNERFETRDVAGAAALLRARFRGGLRDFRLPRRADLLRTRRRLKPP